MKILVINPGATSTKFAVFEDETAIVKVKVEHSAKELNKFTRIFDQYQYRLETILKTIKQKHIDVSNLSAVIARGGLLKPISGGTYIVNENMLVDLKKAERGEHASNLGAVIAYNIGKKMNIPAYIADPVSVDEMEPVARVSGFPEIERVSLFHALNHKAVAHKVAKQIGRKYEELNFVIAHLGSGVSVGAHKKGRVVDVNDCKDEGAFSPDRCGTIPAYQFMKLCYSNKYTYEQMKDKLMPNGGLYAYLGTKDIKEVEDMAKNGQKKAELLLNSMTYQIAKEIGALAAVLCGDVDRIILTGGMTYSKTIVDKIIKRVKFIAPVVVIPGEEELDSLAMGALRVLRKEERAKIYI